MRRVGGSPDPSAPGTSIADRQNVASDAIVTAGPSLVWRTDAPFGIDTRPAALVIAHPGHELRVHGWLEMARPVVFVLTKGDGHAGASRLSSTSSVLSGAGASAGSIFGRLHDREIYDALLRLDTGFFLRLLDELMRMFVQLGVRFVAADADEGYNPSHDVCHYLTATAAILASRRTGGSIGVFDFPLVGAPEACAEDLRDRAIHLELDDEAFARKMEIARAYPGLGAEVERAIETNGANAFRRECLRPVAGDSGPPAACFYERYGERQVAAGLYPEVIRYDPHVRHVRDALRNPAALE